MWTSNADPFPMILVEGDARERGRAHGAGLGAQVTAGVEQYLRRFEHFAGLSRGAAHAAAERFIEPIRAYDPEILEEMEGIAEGAQLEFADVLAMNCRSELMFGTRAPAECSSFALQPSITATGHTYVGQNWDWGTEIIDTIALVAIRQEPLKPDILLLDEAGVVGRMGINSSGIGLCTNTLLAEQSAPTGVPYNVLLRGVLNTRRLDDATGALIRPARAISSNHLIGDARGQTLDIEVAPEEFDYIPPRGGIITHGNHFAGTRIRAVDSGVTRWPDSVYRECRLREAFERVGGSIRVEDMMAALRDEFGAPYAISRTADADLHPLERIETVASIITDCVDRVCWISRGAPTASEYRRISLDDLIAGDLRATEALLGADPAVTPAANPTGGSDVRR
jgi:isopenicillin-N N-acyltransferase-like protein